jgi:hypothetical protein
VALLRKTPAAVADALPVPASNGHLPSIVAAASQVQLEGLSTSSLKIRDLEWQVEAWRHYDICGEFRFVANRHSAALSRCRLYVAEVDELGRPGKEAQDPQIQVLAESVFGGPAAKAEALRTVGTQLYVAGECYVVAEGNNTAQGDKWYVASPMELRKQAGTVQVKRPMTIGGGWKPLSKGADLLMRVWTPHPRLFDVADSPTRSVLPTLREIERLTQLCFSQIDSRLISAGLLLLREGVDFPHAADKDGGIEGLLELILESARAQLTGAGTAAGLVPILATVPTGDNRYADVASSFAHIKFDTPLTAELEKKLDQAIRRLALGLDIAPEDLLGQGDANHWGSWQIEESSIKLFIEPVLVRICDALTTAYLEPALKVLGLDPDKYTLWYDTSPLTVRPNRMEDAMQLWDRGLIGDDALIMAAALSANDKPNAKAQLRWMAWQIVTKNPAAIAAPGIAGMLGFPPEAIAAGLAPAPPAPPPGLEPPPPGPEALPPGQAGPAGSIPEQPTSKTTPAQRGQRGQQFAVLLPAAEQVVYRALELAGGRLLDRQARGRYGDVEKFNLHTRVRPRDREHAREAMAGAWAHLVPLAGHFGVGVGELEYVLREYCTELLMGGYPHDPDLLREVLERGFLP